MGRRAVRRAATAAAVVLCSSGASAFVASPGRRDVAALVARAGHQRQIIRRCRQPASGRLRRHRLASSPALAPNDSEGDIQPVDSEISPSSSSSSSSTSTSTSSTSSGSSSQIPPLSSSAVLDFSTDTTAAAMASSSSSSSSSSAAAAAAAAEVGGAADPPPRSLSLPVLWAVIAAPFFALAYFARGLHWQPFLAGGLSCALSHGVATPFDVVKTRMQTNPEMYDGSVAAAFRRIARHEGPSFLWQGLGPTVVGYGLEGAVKIGVYELLKPVLRASGLNAFWSFIAAGFASGVVASLVLCPAEDIRIRMVADPEYVPKGKGTLSAFLRLCKEEGLLGAYSGFWAMNAKQVPYTISKQCSFDYLTAASYAALGCTAAKGAKAAKAAKFSAKAAKAAKAAKVSSSAAAVFLPPKALLVAGVPLAAATVAAVLSCVASQPGDVLLTATYKDSEHTHGAVGEVWESGGVRALFAGIKARLLHVISTVTVQLVAYDLLKRALGMGATGL